MTIKLPNQPGQPSKGAPLSRGEERALDTQIEELQKQLEGAEVTQGLNHAAPDKSVVRRRLDELKRIRDTRSVTRATGRERDQIEIELKALKEKLQKNMPDWDTYSLTQKKSGMRYIRLRNWILQSEKDPVRKRDIARYRYLCRRMDPDDPHAASMINLFPQR